jgi:hypothetical protein
MAELGRLLIYEASRDWLVRMPIRSAIQNYYSVRNFECHFDRKTHSNEE